MTQTFSYRKESRLLNASQFKAVFDRAKYKASDKYLLLLAIANSTGHARLGLVVAKKHVRTAVKRNRVKRLVRESFRLNQHQLTGLDIVVIARRGVDQLDNPTMQRNLDQLWSRLVKKARRRSIPDA